MFGSGQMLDAVANPSGSNNEDGHTDRMLGLMVDGLRYVAKAPPNHLEVRDAGPCS
ncbi:hypothetical protein [Hoeflea sp. IMCC20628]|uniref:hypothetical protein n=1 Tax=Hoeflea sp. IMCC20628 TaxID=1620421 RepID=UPI000A4D885D|nr:hypothetical protein [Hoeflea sp. IMCC20628]